MVLKFYGDKRSPSTRRVLVILHEKNVPFQFVEVDVIKGQHKAPDNLRRHPFGLVPSIDDNGLILYESRAICRYIATNYPGQGAKLIPTDPKAVTFFEQAASVETANFELYASALAIELVQKPLLGIPTDKAALEKNLAALASTLEVYDMILGKQKYLAGDELTLVDLFHAPLAWELNAAGSDVIVKNPNVARWFKEISTRPSWIATKETQGGLKLLSRA